MKRLPTFPDAEAAISASRARDGRPVACEWSTANSAALLAEANHVSFWTGGTYIAGRGFLVLFLPRAVTLRRKARAARAAKPLSPPPAT